MKTKVIFCDICKDRIIGDHGDIRIKYRAKRKWYLWYEGYWNRIDVCANCLNSIIKAKEESDVLDKIRAEILDEAESDEFPDDFRYGLERAVEIINKYK